MECIMKKLNLHHSVVFSCILTLMLLIGLFYSSTSHAQTNKVVGGTELAYVNHYNGHNYYGSHYYKPGYHYKGSYRTPWTYIGHNCRKTCWVDRWTGRTLSCYKTC